MCIAIPYGKDEKQNESRLWHKIRTTPLYLLSLGALIELLALGLFWFINTHTGLSPADSAASGMALSIQQTITYMLVSGAGGFVFFALAMQFFPRFMQRREIMQDVEIEYLYFGGYFYLTLYNSLFFYLSVYLGSGFVISSILIQSLLMIFAFKPLWWAFYWSRADNKTSGYVLNTLFILLLLVQTGFVFL